MRVDHLLTRNGKLIASRRAADPGLVEVSTNAWQTRTIFAAGVQTVAVDGSDMLVGWFQPQQGQVLAVYDANIEKKKWGVAARSPISAIDQHEILCVDDDSGAWIPMLRDAQTGKTKWRGQALAEEPTWCGFAGLVVGFRLLTDLVFYRRSDGQKLGVVAMGNGLAADRDCLFYAFTNQVVCVSPTSPQN